MSAVYLQQFPIFTIAKKSPFSRTAAHIFVSPGDAPEAITLNVVWMEREFDAYKLSRSMYPSIFNSFCMDGKTIQCSPNPSQHVRTYLQQFPSYSNRKCKKSPFSRTAAHIFVSPGDAPVIITQYVAWMERQFNACQTPRSMYLSIFNGF